MGTTLDLHRAAYSPPSPSTQMAGGDGNDVQLSLYEQRRLATIDENRKVLASLGLVEAADNLRSSMKPTAEKQGGRRKPPVAARPMLLPPRAESTRAKALSEATAKAAEEDMKRREAEEAALEVKRAALKRVRKEREAIQRREHEREERRKAKLEAERKARKQVQDEARREAALAMREIRAERAEALRLQRADVRREREEERKAMLEQIKERVGSLRTTSQASLDSAVKRRAELERVVALRSQDRMRAKHVAMCRHAPRSLEP